MTDCTDVGIDVRQAVKLGHPVRQVVVGIIALLLAVIVWLCAVNPNFGWSTVGYYLFNPNIMTGIQKTIVLTIVAMAIGTLLGLVCALGKMCGVPFFMRLTDLYLWFFRSTPLLVQLLFWYNLAPLFPVLGIPGI